MAERRDQLQASKLVFRRAATPPKGMPAQLKKSSETQKSKTGRPYPLRTNFTQSFVTVPYRGSYP
jgi:hypothetical protein